MSNRLMRRLLGRRLALSVTAYVTLVVLTALPLVGLGLYAHRVAATAVERLVAANNLTAAEITRDLVEREFYHRINTLVGVARGPDVVEAVRQADGERVRQRLEALVESHPLVVRAFVTDPRGLLWSDFPRAPESLGERFDHRDWYLGVTQSWEPYVSEVYRRHAEPRLLLVAVATPIRDPQGGSVVGILVYQLELGELSRMLRGVAVGDDGFVFLLDHRGRLAAHPRLDLQEREYDEYQATALFEGVGGATTLEYVDPFEEVAMLATALPANVRGGRWIVVAQQPRDRAYAPIRVLAWQIGGAGLLLALLVGGLGFGLARESVARRQAQRALERSHRELERRVEERTEELRQREEQLLHAQKMEAVGRLAGGVAHDFNNVLSVILGYSELVLDRLPEDSPLRTEIEEIRQAGERAGELIRQLLAFSRRQVLEPVVLDLNEVVGRMDRMLQRVIGADVDLVTRLGPNLDKVLFDPGRIEQILMNLAVNARDAMPRGGKLTIETRNVELDEDYTRKHADAQPGPHVMLAVTDTGVGMDAETRRRLFEPFFTTKERGKGTGLGLSTVYGIVKQSGGNIWVYSEPGRGTTFKVYLPRAEQAAVEIGAPTASPVESSRGTETVLVVEDDPALRELVVTVLRGAGYTVLEAADADRALELAASRQDPLDLLVTDVVLPGMGGRETAAEIASRRPGIPVIFMSGYTDEAILRQGILEAGSTFLEKPIRPAELLAKVRRVLDGSAGT